MKIRELKIIRSVLSEEIGMSWPVFLISFLFNLFRKKNYI